MKKKLKFEYLKKSDGNVYAVLSRKFRRGYQGKLVIVIGKQTVKKSRRSKIAA